MQPSQYAMLLPNGNFVAVDADGTVNYQTGKTITVDSTICTRQTLTLSSSDSMLCAGRPRSLCSWGKVWRGANRIEGSCVVLSQVVLHRVCALAEKDRLNLRQQVSCAASDVMLRAPLAHV